MKMTLEQIFKSILKTPLISIAIVLMLTAGLFLAGGASAYLRDAGGRTQNLNAVYGSDTARICCFSNASTRGTLYLDGNVTALATYYRTLCEKYPDYRFFRLGGYTMLGIVDYTGPDALITGYSNGNPRKNLTHFYAQLPVTLFDHLVADPGLLDALGVQLSEGDGFAGYEGGAAYDTDAVYPLVLGAGFREAYALGDRVEVALEYSYPITIHCEVTGFVQEGTAILNPLESRTLVSASETAEDKLYYLDNVMILPWIDCTDVDRILPMDDPDFGVTFNLTYVRQLTRQQCWWMLLAIGTCGEQEMKAALVDTAYAIPVGNGADAARLGAFLSVTNNVMNLPSTLKAEIRAFYQLLLYCSIFILIAVVVCVCVNLINKINDNMHNYAIYQLCGANLGDLYRISIGETLFFLLVSELLAIGALGLGGGLLSYRFGDVLRVSGGLSADAVTLMLGLGVLICVLSLIYPLIRISRTEYDTLLRGSE